MPSGSGREVPCEMQKVHVPPQSGPYVPGIRRCCSFSAVAWDLYVFQGLLVTDTHCRISGR